MRYPLILPLLGSTLLLGCAEIVIGSGEIVTESRSVEEFDELNVCCGFRVFVEQGADEGVQLVGDDNILDDISTFVSDGDELWIEYRQRDVVHDPTEPVTVRIVTPQLERIEASGGVDVVTSDLDTEDFAVQLTGGSTLTMGVLVADDLDVSISGDGFMTVAGKIAQQRVELSGESDYDAGNLRSKALKMYMSGDAEATVWVTETLLADLSGESRLFYYGDPVVEQFTSGDAVIEALGGR